MILLKLACKNVNVGFSRQKIGQRKLGYVRRHSHLYVGFATICERHQVFSFSI
jgi:hypothetical protein